MKHLILTSFTLLALAACSDTPEEKLDEAYQGGGETAVQLIEGAPKPPAPPAEKRPVEPSPEADIIDPVLTDQPSEMRAPDEIVGDNPGEIVETVLPETDGDVKAPEIVLGPDELPEIEAPGEGAGEASQDKGDEPGEDKRDTETPQ